MNAPVEALQSSPATLAKAMAGAAIGAGLILTLFVLPAETGYDPTGIGGALGLTGMAATNTEAQPATSSDFVIGTKATIEKATPWRTDEKSLTLAPHSGAEIKAHMVKGDSLIFHWEAEGGPVKMDMHGEPPNAKDGEFTTYWKELGLTSAQGSFTATFDGRHGWYWRNKGDVPVTIRLKTAGFYRNLFQPEG